VERIVVDPSAASFITALRREGFVVQSAKNDVLAGIRLTADLLKRGKVVICEGCEDCLCEMEGYCWEEDGEKEMPRKVDDHAMDELRYFAVTVAEGELRWENMGAVAVERRG
jgi:hypothetical protein